MYESTVCKLCANIDKAVAISQTSLDAHSDAEDLHYHGDDEDNLQFRRSDRSNCYRRFPSLSSADDHPVAEDFEYEDDEQDNELHGLTVSSNRHEFQSYSPHTSLHLLHRRSRKVEFAVCGTPAP